MRARELHFPPFRLDLAGGQLWRGVEPIPLRPKTLAVLQHLVERPAQLVAREELVTAVWDAAAGSEQLPKGCVRELRAALGDDAATPRFIETVGRRGYRFVAPVTLGAVRDPARDRIVGRVSELADLHRWMDAALAGERRIGFVTGEPGIGKTTLVAEFVDGIPDETCWTGRGQCIEHFGPGEAYLPVLEALGRLCRRADGGTLVGLLVRHAPTWLSEMPALLDDATLERVQRRAQGATRERMLRELAEAIEVVSAERTLVLVLEDLQWSDPSTLDLLVYLARRQEPARLLVIGTYRPADVIVSGHALRAVRQDLRARGECEELALGALGRADVAAYLDARFPVHAFGAELAATLHRTTDGNPLFLVSLVDDLVARGALVERAGRWSVDGEAAAGTADVPAGLRALIDRQVDRLDPMDQRLLEAASVVGSEFAADTVAAALAGDARVAEDRLAGLARREVLIRAGPSGAGYEFSHTLHQRVLYERLDAARRRRLHGDVGGWLEGAYGPRAGEAAVQLAEHFERGGRAAAAAYYRLTAARTALGRHAHPEAIAHLGRALELLDGQPDGLERATQQLGALVTLGAALMAMRGHAIREAERLYVHARALCWQLGAAHLLLPVLRGLQRVHLVRGDLGEAQKLAAQYLELAERLGAGSTLPDAHLAVGEALVVRGALAEGLGHLCRGMELHAPRRASSEVSVLQDPGIGCRFYVAIARWLEGAVDQALERVRDMCAAAEALGQPYSLAYATGRAAWFHHLRRDPEATRAAAEIALGHATANGFELIRAQATLLRGWAITMQGDPVEGIALMREGEAAWESAGAVLVRPLHLALLAEGVARAGSVEEGLGLLAEARAVAERTGERWWEAELYRLTGELSLRGGRQRAEAERGFRHAIEVARQQGARSLELRAAVSLCRLPGRRGSSKPPDEALAAAYAQFTEGLESADLRDARALLGQ
jgi:DNA-binding winged helix-turn-helix (wHTH) protein